jgi:phage gp46-like protein
MIIDGQPASPGDVTEPLIRAVIVSLFTWRRAQIDDHPPDTEKMGWWGDSYSNEPNRPIGSRLWLLGRSKLTDDIPILAIGYAQEALLWLVEEGVAAAVEVRAERQGLDILALGIVIVRGDASTLDIRFADVWNYLHV